MPRKRRRHCESRVSSRSGGGPGQAGYITVKEESFTQSLSRGKHALPGGVQKLSGFSFISAVNANENFSGSALWVDGRFPKWWGTLTEGECIYCEESEKQFLIIMNEKGGVLRCGYEVFKTPLTFNIDVGVTFQ